MKKYKTLEQLFTDNNGEQIKVRCKSWAKDEWNLIIGKKINGSIVVEANSGEVFSREPDDINKWELYTEPAPVQPRLIAWIHKNIYDKDSEYRAESLFLTMENGAIGDNYIRVPWLDQEFLEKILEK